MKRRSRRIASLCSVLASLSAQTTGALGVEIAPPDSAPAYGPLAPAVSQPAVTSDGGLLLRDGRPFFWIGCGDGFGANQATPTGLWLSWLQGCTMLTANGVAGTPGAKLDESGSGNQLRFSQPFPAANISWLREALRLGFLCDSPFGSPTTMKRAPWGALAERRADAAAFLRQIGHYITIDALTPEGSAVQRARRAPYWGWAASNAPHGRVIAELCREPGPSPRDAATLGRFREWACARYGGDIAAANALWNTDFPAWNAVTPPHLLPGTERSALRRQAFAFARKQCPILHLDWCSFVRDESTQAFAAEAADVRDYAPGLPVTLDLRSHRRALDDDAGPALDPERIDPFVDLLFVHKVWPSRAYPDAGEPCDVPTLLSDTAFPLFSLEYFRSISSRPIIDTEDIVALAAPPLSNLDGMRRNDLAQMLSRPWKFRLEKSGEDGLRDGWSAPGFDDDGWDALSVPGCWDEDSRWKGRSGVGWYRIRFFLPAYYSHDFADDSRQFYLVGKGVAQRGEVWVNGASAGNVEGWDEEYRLDIGPLLAFGATNTVVWRVDGSGSQNGLRFSCHVLPSDGFGEARPVGEKEHAAMLWTELFRGVSGALVWEWSGADRLRPWMPGLARRLAAIAPVALPAARHRRSRCAILFSHLSARGLPASEVPDHDRETAPFCALEFAGAAPEIPGERTFRRRIVEDPAAWQLVVVPHVEHVEAATWNALVSFLRAGGTVVATSDSFKDRFDDWAPLGGPDALAEASGGRVVVVPEDAGLDDWTAALAPLLPPPEIPVSEAGGETREPPLFERFLLGGGSRKALYLHNWGGCTHEIEVSLPPEVAGWRVRAVEGGPFAAVGDSGTVLRVRVPSQGVAVALLESPSDEPLPDSLFRPSREHEAAMGRLAALLAPAPDGDARPLVLVEAEPEKGDRGGAGAEHWGRLLDRFDAFGLRPVCAPLDTWTPERLSSARLVFFGEMRDLRTRNIGKEPNADGDTLEAMIERYVSEGGSLLLLAHDMGLVNQRAGASRRIAKALGVPWAKDYAWLARSDAAGASSGHGDPLQFLVRKDGLASGHPCTEGVEAVQFWDLMPLRLSEEAEAEGAVALARLPAEAGAAAGLPCAVALEHGKGRAVIIPDTMLFQPFRIDDADNAAFLENILAWLLREEIDDARRAAARGNPFLSGESFRRMAEEEARRP